MSARDYDSGQGQAFQGEIAIIPMPPEIQIATSDEIAPVDGRLIIQEGEATGHHHAIELGDPRVRYFRQPLGTAADVGMRNTRRRRAFGGGPNKATARLYRDADAMQELWRRGILTRTDLAIGCLVVEGGAIVVAHEEHDGIRLPPGNYYVGRQTERTADADRVVAD